MKSVNDGATASVFMRQNASLPQHASFARLLPRNEESHRRWVLMAIQATFEFNCHLYPSGSLRLCPSAFYVLVPTKDERWIKGSPVVVNMVLVFDSRPLFVKSLLMARNEIDDRPVGITSHNFFQVLRQCPAWWDILFLLVFSFPLFCGGPLGTPTFVKNWSFIILPGKTIALLP